MVQPFHSGRINSGALAKSALDPEGAWGIYVVMFFFPIFFFPFIVSHNFLLTQASWKYQILD